MEWDLLAGGMIDGWTLVERLGKGGNGEVWVAEHSTLGTAALKLLKLRFQGQEQKRYLRFRDEATMHQQLSGQHPGVLPFLGCSLPEDPTPGTPAWLATKVARRAQETLVGKPLCEAVEAAASVADTMAQLHGQGISHRDIKPDNLFWHESRWVVGDFGLVDYPDKESLTDTGERLGPFHYLAPEMQHEANRSDGRIADVYSLGKTLWVLATGQNVPPPGELRADNGQLCIRAYRADPRSHQLDLLIERATRHDPTMRPTMAEFVAELRAWLRAPQAPAKPDLTDVLARIRAFAPPALRSAEDRTKLIRSAEQLKMQLESGMRRIAQQLASTGLSDGEVGSVASADRFLEQELKTGDIWGINLLCRAALPVGAGWAQLRCTVALRAYPDGIAQFSAGYGVGLGNTRDYFIGKKVWAGMLGSAAQDQAVADLMTSLNESLGESLTVLAGLAQTAAAQDR